jgi:methionine-S-sulfoxide reductase
VRDVASSNFVQAWLSGATDPPYFALGACAALVGFFGFQLAKMAGFGKVDYYDGLEGLEVNSLSSQAAEWALAGEVPVRSKDGQYEVATFAGGCFWGTELHFQRIPGVIATAVGYTQGRTEKPNYAEVGSGVTGHTEALQLLFDPAVVSYDTLCDELFQTVDSTRLNLAGNDIGTQYRNGIYPHSEAQQEAAIAAIMREQAIKQRFNSKVVTEVERAAVFWPAEKYHQRKLQKGGQSAEKGETKSIRCYG